MSGRGHLLIISGPAGAGKGTLLADLFAAIPELAYSISCTTRDPRPGEADGREYWFVSTDDFLRQRDEGMFLEWAEVHGRYYGTRRKDVERALDEGRSIVLEIDVVGAANVRAAMPEASAIFIMPPSIEILRERLAGRGTETPEQFELRMADAHTELARADEYDFQIVNDDRARASEELIGIVRGIIS